MIKQCEENSEQFFSNPVSGIADLFSRHVQQASQSAIYDDYRSMSYEQLDGLANSIAKAILDKIGYSSARICILSPQHHTAVAGMLGVLKAGKCFVPMLPQDGDHYLRYLWKNSAASLLLTDIDNYERAVSLCGDKRFVLLPGERLSSINIPENNNAEMQNRLAAIMYTSGSTGQPKGVMTTEQCILLRAFHHIEMAHIVPGDRQASIAPWQFCASFPDIFGSLLAGASLFMYDNYNQGIERLVPWVKKHSISLLHLPAAFVRRFVQCAAAEILATVRYVYISGGSLEISDARALLDLLPEEAVLLHGFGSTETNLVAKMEWRRSDAIFQGDTSNKILPAGYPVAGKQISILDNEGKPATPGEEGEVVVTSRHLTPGYWNQPELTSRSISFLNNGDVSYKTGDMGCIREDGCLELIGRKGRRVKIRGLRIDLDAVELLLRALPYVREAVAISHTSSRREAQLVAYVEPAHSNLLTTTKLREDMLAMAPNSMIPSRFVLMDALPRTASGKIDRTSLPAPGRERPMLDNPYEPPQTQMEKKLAGIWSKVLEIDEVGLNDNFLECGGDSLSALHLFLEIEQLFGQKVSTAKFFQEPTIAHLTLILNRQMNGEMRAETEAPPWLGGVEQQKHPKTKLQPSVLWYGGMKDIRERVRHKAVDFTDKVKLSFLTWLYGKKWAQLVFAWGRARLIEKFYSLLENPLQSEMEAIQCSLIADDPRVIHKQLLKQVFSHRPGYWTLQVDTAHAERACQRGNGVVLVGRHTGLNRFVRELAVERLKPCDYEYIAMLASFLPEGTNALPASERRRLKLQIYLDQLLKSKSVLSRGGVVFVLPDERGGLSRGVDLPFHGRMISFKAGFAELAVETGAVVIPVSVTMDVCKRQVKIIFLEQLDNGKADMGHAQRVEGLVRQYAVFLKQEWARCPGIVPLRLKKKHLDSPPLDAIE